MQLNEPGKEELERVPDRRQSRQNYILTDLRIRKFKPLITLGSPAAEAGS